MAADSETTIAVLHDGRTEIRVSALCTNGRRQIELREWYRKGDEMRPTAHGLRLKPDRLPALVDVVSLALTNARERKLIT